MGMWSYFTQDTHHRIVNGEPFRVVMCDDKGNKYVEECYEGYGEFGGKDFYELVAEMNGYAITEKYGMFHTDDISGLNLYWNTLEQAKDSLRKIGITLAFDGHPCGDNPNIIYPSLTESGEYMGGKCPESDPDQGFPMDEDEEYEEDEEEFDALEYNQMTLKEWMEE